jgi:hypothetical protein
MSSAAYFDGDKVSRLIALGYPHNEIIPHFIPLVNTVLRSGVVYDNHNHTEEDLRQIGLIKSQEVIEKFNPTQGNLFAYASILIKHAIWTEARLRPLDRKRVTDEIDFDQQASFQPPPHVEPPQLDEQFFTDLRLENENHKAAARYIFGVLMYNDYESNRARVLKTLSNGYDVNLKQARFLIDHVLVALRRKFSRGAQEVRDDKLFDNRYKHTVVPELRDLLGERAFERLIHYFGGMTVSIPSVSQIDTIDRDIAILKALATDWHCGPTLAKKHGISPEGIKAVYKACLHKLHTDSEFARLVAEQIPLDQIPGAEFPFESPTKKKPMPGFGERKMVPRRKVNNTDSMGFVLGCRNSLLYTLIVTGKCTRADLVKSVVAKFGGTESSAKATVSAFLSDIKHPFGKFNTSRNLKINVDGMGRLSFEKESLIAAQQVISIKRAILQESIDGADGKTAVVVN